MNRRFRSFLIGGFLCLPGAALADLAEDAVRVAESVLGIGKAISCTANGNPVLQWKFNIITGNRNIMEGNYLEAFNLSRPIVTSFNLSTSDRLNGLSWRGKVEWQAESHRYYDNYGSILGFRGLGTWDGRNPLFSVPIEQRHGQWIPLDSGIRNPVVDSAGCADFTALADQARQEKEEKLRVIQENERRRYEQNLQKYPIAPHKSDPYYVPRQVPGSRECYPGAGRACY